ncbi:MAG TPA: YhcH/YjgK/YiaL family protein [Pirellulaceae bacterium]|nr:YhcH/YjgK/YiaL family protein [Pirellulaceae bacterium]
MILDKLTSADQYKTLHPRIAAALDWLKKTDLAALPLGKTVIDGEHLFALVQEYTPKEPELLKYEAHRRYWDVQVVVSGSERMGWAHLSQMTVSEPHDEARDVAFYRGDGQFVLVPAGFFTIFSPHDVHMPGVAAEPLGPVRKVVVKVEIA